MDIRMYGNAALGTTRRGCASSAQNQDRLRNNLAIGVDHELSIYGGTEVLDRTCSAFPNTLEPGTGNAQSAFTGGLVKTNAGDSNIDDANGARLQRGQYPKATYLQRSIDNKPMYEFIPSGVTLPDVPNSCQRQAFDTIIAAFPMNQRQAVIHSQLQKCFWEYRCNKPDQNPNDLTNGSCTAPSRGTVAGPLGECGFDGCNGVVFSANTDPFGDEGDIDLFDIQLTPRFAYVPQFQEAVPGPGGSVDQHILRFRAVYLQRLDAGCTGNGTCGAVFEPGPWNPGGNGNNQNLDAVTAFVFERNMLPGTLGDGPNQLGVNLSIRLVR
jgi:hypothetical protein